MKKDNPYIKKTISLLMIKMPGKKEKYAVAKKNLIKFCYDKRRYLYILPLKEVREAVRQNHNRKRKMRII